MKISLVNSGRYMSSFVKLLAFSSAVLLQHSNKPTATTLCHRLTCFSTAFANMFAFYPKCFSQSSVKKHKHDGKLHRYLMTACVLQFALVLTSVCECVCGFSHFTPFILSR